MKMRILVSTLLLALPLAACTDQGTDAAKSLSDTGSSIGRSVLRYFNPGYHPRTEGDIRVAN